MTCRVIKRANSVTKGWDDKVKKSSSAYDNWNCGCNEVRWFSLWGLVCSQELNVCVDSVSYTIGVGEAWDNTGRC